MYMPYYAASGFDNIQKYLNQPATNFRDLSFLKNTIAFVGGDNVLVDAPNGDKSGYYLVRNEIFKEDDNSIYVYQMAYTRQSDTTANGDARSYARYLLFSKANGTFSSSSVSDWKEIGNLNSKDIIVTDKMLATSDIKDYVIPFEQFESGSANGLVYLTNHVYRHGYIKSVKTRTSTSDDVEVTLYLVKTIDNAVLRKITTTGHGEITFNVDEYIGLDFYVGIAGKTNYKGIGNGVIEGLNFATVGVYDTPINQGDIMDITFPSRASSDTIYIAAQEVSYISLAEESKGTNDIVRTHNAMFACGDSITAGFPNYEVGAHWWENVGRDLGFTVKVGARSGSGVSYYNGTNACKIVKNADLSGYNLAVFAFGTNDFGKNIPIGTINDEYTYSEDSSQTFYAALKYVIKTAKQKNPKMMVIWSLPINRTKANIADNVTGSETIGSIETKWAYGVANKAGHTLNDYCEAIIAVCELYGIPYIDHRKGAFDVFSLDTLLVDGLHPSQDGYKVFGQEMSAKISALIRPYCEYNGKNGVGEW